MSQSWYELTRSFEAELEDNKEDILAADYPEDLIHEYADSNIPIYYSDLAALLAENTDLAYPDDYCGGADVDVFKIIQWSIYEQLLSIGYEWLEAAKEEKAEQEEAEANEAEGE
jgi:hypothetical protein